jgi:hypothetical protein
MTVRLIRRARHRMRRVALVGKAERAQASAATPIESVDLNRLEGGCDEDMERRRLSGNNLVVLPRQRR